MKKNALPITRKEDFAEWYQAVIKGADLAENSGVRGCMIIKPWGYAIWERMQKLLDGKIKATGHENCYFPIFIPLDLFEKEAEHIQGFAKEMAIVTHHRLEEKDGKLQIAGKLEIPLVVRPTSETVISEAFSRWVSSYRDLPIKINQWANVVRWEMRPRMFLRTAEFLWQEGHTAHESQVEAEEETLQMLEVYRTFVEDEMCIPLIVGKKSPSERFPGAVETYCIEAMMQDGKALQAGTSHYLGQTFSKASGIKFQDKDGVLQYAHTTSWGVSTRLIGGMIMTHSDDDGLRLPPKIAPRQIVILPVLKNQDKTDEVLEACKALKDRLDNCSFGFENIRASVEIPKGDDRGRYWDWVRKGVPIICEVGPRDLENDTVAVAVRDKVGDKKKILKVDEFVKTAGNILGEYEKELLRAAKAYRDERTVTGLSDLAALREYFEKNESGFAMVKWSEDSESEESLKQMGVTIRCLPLIQSGQEGICALTGKRATIDVVLAKSY